MSSILDIRKMRAFSMTMTVPEENIAAAEEELKLSFSVEYREYLLAFGCASVYGHELTGLGASERLDVVAVTEEERRFCPSIPNGFYVVEQTHFDDIVIWQSESGEIFRTCCDSQPVKIFDSLYEYLAAEI